MALIIKSGNVFDLVKNKFSPGDILIKNDKIAGVGKYGSEKKINLINAKNHFVLPGFIDVYSGLDHFLGLLQPERSAVFLKNGITSAIAGQGGKSLIPTILPKQFPATGSLFNYPNLNSNWTDASELAVFLKKKRSYVNFATLIGLETVRSYLAQINILPESKRWLKSALFLIGKNLEFSPGISVNLGSDKSDWNLETISKLASKLPNQQGKSVVISIFLPEFKQKYYELIQKIAKNNHLKIQITSWDNQVIQKIEGKISDSELKEKILLVNNLDSKKILDRNDFLPAWTEEKTVSQIQEMLNQKKYLNSLEKLAKKIAASDLTVEHISPQFRFWVGKKLSQIASSLSLPLIDAFIYVLRATHFNVVFSASHSKQMGRKKKTINSSAIPSSLGHHFRLTENIFQKYLHQFSNENDLIKAIKNITIKPAKFYQLNRRGEVKRNYYADLVIVDDKLNIKTVIINGQIAVLGNEWLKVKNGQYLEQILEKTK